MEKDKKRTLGHTARFSLLNIVAYCIVAVAFLVFQNTLPASKSVALEFFKPYRPLGIMVIFDQLLKGVIIALILYPFFDKIRRSRRGWMILFGAIWGLSLLGSVSPMPGSLEGLVYTKTTITEHLAVLFAGAVQTAIFATILLNWEKRINGETVPIDSPEIGSTQKFVGYSLRFILIHVVTYVIVGMAFYNLQNYEDALNTMEAFKLYRNLEDPLIASLIIPSQIFRGGLLALFIYPFHSIFIEKKKGWLHLFVLLYGLTFAVLLANDFTESFTQGFSISEMLTGSVEVSVQMLVFSWLFFKWEKRREKKRTTKITSYS